MRWLRAVSVALALLAPACAGGQVDHVECVAPVSGGTAAQRAVVNGVLCAMASDQRWIVSIRRSPRGEPAGSAGLVFIARMPPEPASPRGPRAARARFADDQVSWDAAIAAGAIRDKSQAAHLPHVVSYLLMFRTPGHRPATQSQEQMALPGWGSPEGQGSPPPASLGHGAASFDTVQRRLTSIARQTHTRVRLGWGVPLGAAPAVVITTAAPIRLLAGPIRRYLAAVDFQGGRYDGVLVAVFDRRGNPVWAATTAERVGTRGCSVYSGEAGKSHGSFPAFSSAGDRACAAAGVEFS